MISITRYIQYLNRAPMLGNNKGVFRGEPMSNNKTNTVQKLVSVFILWCMAASGLVGIFAATVGSGSVPQPVANLVPSVINSYVEIRDQGVYDANFNITVNAGGTLKIVNSTLNFPQSETTDYFILVNTGGSLILENSTITTGATPQAMWDPFFEISLSSATLEMTDHSVLAFPGELNALDTTVLIADSWITSLAPDALTDIEYAQNFPTFYGVVDSWWGTLDDDQDDGPIMSFEDCDEAVITDSRIDEVYEDETLLPYQNIQLHPNSLDINDGTGGLINVANLDGADYVLDSLETIGVGGFDITGFDDVNYSIISVELFVVYNNPSYTYSVGYELPPFNGFNYSVLNFIPETFAFQVEENQIADAYVTEPTTIVSFNQISQMKVNFTAHESGADNPINIDTILLNVVYQPVVTHTPSPTNIITLDNTEMTVINSYIAVDWSSIPDDYSNKNAFEIIGASNLYMYNMTIEDDEGGVGGENDALEIPEGADPVDYMPFRVDDSSNAYYFKWLETSVIDRYAMPIPGATLNATFRFTEAAFVNQVSAINDFTGDANANWANAKTVVTDYLNSMYGISAATFNVTGADGKVHVPLLTTIIEPANYPNGNHTGEYDIEITFPASAGGFTACDFIPMPSIAEAENTNTLTVQLADIELDRPFGSPGLIVSSGSVTLDGGIDDSLAVNDFIIVENGGTLTISNADMLMAYSGAAPFHITVREQGTLILDGVDLSTQGNLLLTITVEDEAELTMIDSATTGSISITASDDATVNFNRTELGGRFATEAGANVRLNAWSTMFSQSLDQFHGTSNATLVGCYSPISPNFRIEPSDTAVVWNYRWAEITVFNGLIPAKTLPNTDVWVSSQYTEFGALLNNAGSTNSDGVYLTYALSDYFHYDPATSEVVESHYNLYDLVTRYQLGTGDIHNETTGLGLAAYPLMGYSDAISSKSVVLQDVLPDLDPPLTVWPIGTDSDVGRGNEVWINTTITNSGDAEATGITVRFNDIFGETNRTIQTNYTATLGPGESWNITFPYTWDEVEEIGWHNITVFVDPSDTVNEQDEWNNFNWILINVTSQADLAVLQVSDVWASEMYPLVDDPFTLFARVWNYGDIDATNVVVAFYSDGVLLNTDTIDLIAANPDASVLASITVTYTQNGTHQITVFVDSDNSVSEVDETNNNNTLWPMTLRVWDYPGLFISSVEVVEGTLAEASLGLGTVTVQTNNRTDVVLRAVVGNNGELFASSVYVRFYNDGLLIGTAPVISSISSGSARIATCVWEALTDGVLEQNYTISAIATANGGTLTSNEEDANVLTVIDNRADIELLDIELANNITEITGNTDFSLNITIANNGYLDAEDFSIEVYASFDSWIVTQEDWFEGDENYTERIGNLTVALLPGGSEIIREVECTGVPTGDYEIFVIIDSDLNNTDAIAYDDITPIIGFIEEYDETNNNDTISGTAVMPALMARIQLPEPGIIDGKWTNVYIEGETSSVEIRGFIVRVDAQSIGVQGVEVTVSVEGGETYTTTTGQAGAFTVSIPITSTGNYTVTVSGDGIASDTTWFRVDTASVFPFWIIILIVIIVVVIIVGITLYLYFVGLGKTVQCGECGAFIPEGAAKCPKCGVEFETEVAKCSVCGAWVPIDVKNCPECGTEFTVGTEDLDDYEAKMKRQYDDVVRKFREQAKTEIGKEFTETEFQAWWASKPTFITFDQWLKEEEEMKRMGSRPCPVCQMENSVTAKICHKCGSVMGDAKAPAPKKPEGKMPPAEKKPAAAAPAPAPQRQQPPAAQQQQAAAPPAPAQAAPQQPAATPGKKGCPSCGMEVNAGEKICPICNYDFGDQSGAQATRIVRKPIKKIVRRPGEPGGDQQQQQ